jgi:hypothetical protein
VRQLSWAAPVAALFLAACARPARPALQNAEPTSLAPLSTADMNAIAEAVQRLRGLPARSPIAIAKLDEQSFFSALMAAPRKEDGQARSHKLTIPSFAEPETSSDDHVLRAARSSIAGFYQTDSRQIYLKSSATATRKERLLERMTVAHEVEHALQAQHFSDLYTARAPHEDVHLARLALIEGDADVTGLAYISWENNVPVGRPLAKILRLIGKTPTDQLLSEDGGSIARLSPIERERLMFPYLAGDGFAAELHRTGGFDLINRAFAHPPETTEQILHPERYLAGEGAVPVPMPAPPSGYTAVAAGHMGELQTRALLLGCLPWDRASKAADGWGGDAFTLVSSSGARRGLLWSTTWDSEADAADFESALAASFACLPPLPGSSASPNAPVPTLFRRSGRHVALARGLLPDELSPATDRLLASPGEPAAPVPPLGAVALRPLPPRPEHQPGVFQGSVYTSTWLGIQAVLPPNYAARTGSDGLELTIDGPGASGGMVFVSDRIVTPRTTSALFDDVAAAFARKTRYELAVVETNPYRIPIGEVVLRRWNVKYTQMIIEVAILPICGGAGALAILRTWANPYDKAVLDTWFLSFRALPAAPVCWELSP